MNKHVVAAALAAAILLSGCTARNKTTVVTIEPRTVAPLSADVNTYVFNLNTGVVHRPGCAYAQKIADDHREEITCTRDELLARGWNLCDYCRP